MSILSSFNYGTGWLVSRLPRFVVDLPALLTREVSTDADAWKVLNRTESWYAASGYRRFQPGQTLEERDSVHPDRRLQILGFTPANEYVVWNSGESHAPVLTMHPSHADRYYKLAHDSPKPYLAADYAAFKYTPGQRFLNTSTNSTSVICGIYQDPDSKKLGYVALHQLQENLKSSSPPASDIARWCHLMSKEELEDNPHYRPIFASANSENSPHSEPAQNLA